MCEGGEFINLHIYAKSISINTHIHTYIQCHQIVVQRHILVMLCGYHIIVVNCSGWCSELTIILVVAATATVAAVEVEIAERPTHSGGRGSGQPYYLSHLPTLATSSLLMPTASAALPYYRNKKTLLLQASRSAVPTIIAEAYHRSHVDDASTYIIISTSISSWWFVWVNDD